MAGAKIVYETRVDPRFPLARPELAEICNLILDALDLFGRTFSLTVVDDRRIAEINAEFLGCTGPTNILSFPAAGAGDPVLQAEDAGDLGELVLSVDTLAREAALYGQTHLEHLARLLAHGILHLAGHDHGGEMFDLTDAAVDRVLLECGN